MFTGTPPPCVHQYQGSAILASILAGRSLVAGLPKTKEVFLPSHAGPFAHAASDCSQQALCELTGQREPTVHPPAYMCKLNYAPAASQALLVRALPASVAMLRLSFAFH